MQGRALSVGCIAVALIAAAMFFANRTDVDGTRAGPWVPDSADTVVLPLGDGEGALRRLAALRGRLQGNPADADAASRYAALALEHYAVTGDARFLGFAEGALAPWHDDASPPPAIWILRGRILQTAHRFTDAGMELDRMLKAHPGSVAAMLLAADASRRAGEIDKARARCAGVALAGRQDLARYCAADVLLSLGNAAQAWRVVSAMTIPTADAGTGTVQWALAVRADAAAATGQSRAAEADYRHALALPGAAVALHVAYADLLLDAERPQDAIDTLAGLPASDAVLLRSAMAAQRLDRPELEDYRARLLESFSNAEALGAGALHLREKAMFALNVEQDAIAALAHAKDNWRIQKGPEDAAILIRSAEAADEPEASQPVFEWRRHFDSEAR